MKPGQWDRDVKKLLMTESSCRVEDYSSFWSVDSSFTFSQYQWKSLLEQYFNLIPMKTKLFQVNCSCKIQVCFSWFLCSKQLHSLFFKDINTYFQKVPEDYFYYKQAEIPLIHLHWKKIKLGCVASTSSALSNSHYLYVIIVIILIIITIIFTALFLRTPLRKKRGTFLD